MHSASNSPAALLGQTVDRSSADDGSGSKLVVSAELQGGPLAQKYPFYKAEYIWVDGTQPVNKLRSKAKVVPIGQEPPIWGFDGSSTQQATGDRSDCVLRPVFVCDDPIRGEPK